MQRIFTNELKLTYVLPIYTCKSDDHCLYLKTTCACLFQYCHSLKNIFERLVMCSRFSN